MELGATVCTAKSPDCSACPVKASCLAHKLTAAAAGSGETKGLKTKAGAARSPRRRASAAAASGASRAGATCGCTVCEAGQDGTAVVPEAVTDFPRKAAKT